MWIPLHGEEVALVHPHKGNFYSAGDTVELSAKVLGSVFLIGSEIHIFGDVEGDVIATGGTIVIAGRVTGNLRLAGGLIIIDGSVGKDVFIMGGNVHLSSSSHVEGSIAIAGSAVNLDGTVMGGGRVTASTLRILGSIQGNLKASVEKFMIGPTGVIQGDLTYTSANDAHFERGSQVFGNVLFQPSIFGEALRGHWRQWALFLSRYTGLLMNFFFTFVLGWIMIHFFHDKLHRAIDCLRMHPIRCFFFGILAVILLPLFSFFLFISILGLPIGLALLVLSVLTFYTAKVVTLVWASGAFFFRLGFKRDSVVAYLFMLLLFFPLTQIPTIGSLLSLFVTLIGLGAFLKGKKRVT